MIICPKCGAELADEDRFCNLCGEELTEFRPEVAPETQEGVPAEEITPAMDEAAPEKPKKKLKWWMIVVPVVLAAAVLVGCFWNRIVFAVAPQAVFAKAAANTVSELQKRSQGNPLELMKTAMDETGKTTTTMSVEMIEKTFGINMGIDWKSQSDVLAKQQSAEIEVSMYGSSFDLSVYLDPDCMTIGASILNDGQPYGVTFDTIREDMEKSDLFAELSEEEKSQFADFMEMVSDQLNGSWSEEAYEALAAEYLAVFQDVIADLELEKRWEKLDLNGTTRNCAVIGFTLTQTEIADLWDGLLDVTEQNEWLRDQQEANAKIYDENGEEENLLAELRAAVATIRNEAQVTGKLGFYIFDEKILNVGVDIDYTDTDSSYTLDLDVLFGENPATEDIGIACVYADAEETVNMVFALETRNEESLRGDSLSFTATNKSGEQLEAAVSYLWNTVTGDLELTLDAGGSAEEDPIHIAYTVSLRPIQDGYTLDFGDLAVLVGQLTEEDTENMELNLSVSVVRGCDITKPAYINLDQWSVDDLDGLINGLYGGFYG